MTREEKAQYCIDNPKKSPAFQFYPDNWWGSRHVAAMDIEQRGIHACFLFSAWLENNCGIPENEICLSARIAEDKKPIALTVLNSCWFLYQNFWFNERLLNERIKQVELSNVRKNSGEQGGRPLKSKTYNQKAIDNQLDSKPKAKITKSEDEIEDEKEIRKKKEFIIPSFEEFEKYCIENEFGHIADRAYKYYSAADWHDGQGKTIKNWKQKLQGVWFQEKNKINNSPKNFYQPQQALERL
jgi:uncharacterized protein YdaU (DUF1376 family)